MTKHFTSPLPAALSRRQALAAALGGLLLPAAAWAQKSPAQPLVEVWKGPSCGCCKDWVAHLEANGFRTRTHDTGNTEARARMGVNIRLGSCHTGQVGGYAIEGHVPAADIQRLLRERPRAIGLAVPGMPLGSPGMDGPEYGGRRDAYEVLLIAPDGSTTVYSSHA
jgi:hypothetical protein